jgi:HEAT repeat protein
LVCACCLAAPTVGLGQSETVWEETTVAEWIEALDDADDRVQWYAAYALGQLGGDAAEAVEPLTELLAQKSRNEYVRGNAATALGKIGVATQPVLDVLVDAMDTEVHTSVRRNCPLALGALGAAAGPAVPALVALLADNDAAVRVNAAVALWQIEQHPRALPVLEELIRRGRAPAPYFTAVALGRLGAEPRVVAPVLVEALGHDDADVRRAAARSLGQLGRAALTSLKKPLDDGNAEVRRSAVEAMGFIGAEAVPALIYALRNDAHQARRAAARSLGRLGAAAKAAEAALIQAINDRDAQVREAAAKALKEIRQG